MRLSTTADLETPPTGDGNNTVGDWRSSKDWMHFSRDGR